MQFATMISAPSVPFDREAKRRELQRCLSTISGVSIPDERLDRYPSFDLAQLADADGRRAFLEAIDWAPSEASAAPGG
jgi:hypothetical protein